MNLICVFTVYIFNVARFYLNNFLATFLKSVSTLKSNKIDETFRYLNDIFKKS